MMWVVKLGGSLLGSPELNRWLDILVEISDGKVMIVPGGSVFADAVRQAQRISMINDAVAHHLALLAMDQFGLLLAGMNQNLVTASSELELAERGWQHRGIVWLPSRMVLADETIPKNWQMTSDSLSLWLAEKMAATHVVLVKSKDLAMYKHTQTDSVQTMIADGLIDQSFAAYAATSKAQIWLLNKADYRAFAQGLDIEYIQHYALKARAME